MANQFNTFMTNLGIKNPKRKGVGFDFAPFTVEQGQPTPGQTMFEKVGQRKETGKTLYDQGRTSQTNRVASDVAGKSAFSIPTDEFGLVNQTLTDFRPILTNQVRSTRERGQIALQSEQAKTAWQQAKTMQDLGQYQFSGGVSITGNGTDIPGASGSNAGAKAVSLAMKAANAGTPYVWGGNSLTKGVDCSGLVQQVYRQLGISVPRTTYEQAKSGKAVSLNALRPGDLVFYRGQGHVGIYMGNGKIVHAANSKLGIITSNLTNSNGSPTLAIRPY